MRCLPIFVFLSCQLTGQSLFDLAPDVATDDRLPLTFTVSINIGYPDQVRVFPPRAFFFGDSLSDTGNIAGLLGSLGPGYPGSSFTNGTTWVGSFAPSSRTIFESLGSQGLDLSRSVNLATGGATTSTVLNQQINALFLPAAQITTFRGHDHAFLWAGGNDFLPLFESASAPSTQDLVAKSAAALNNLTDSVAALDAIGLPNIAVVSLINLGLTPRAALFSEEGDALATTFNSQLRQQIAALAPSANLLWIDAKAFLDDTVAHPETYQLTNVTEALAPNARDGIPSAITPEEQDGYLFYDQIHPSSAAHRFFAEFAAHHLALATDAAALNLLTDAALFLDDRFGFENGHLAPGASDFQISAIQSETSTGPQRRQSTGVRARLDYALNERVKLGGISYFAQGESGRTELESFGFGLNTAFHDHSDHLAWEFGLGAGMVWGTMTRDYDLGSFVADSHQKAFVATAHAALQSRDWTLGSLPATWQLGLKQRLVHRSSATESAAASLSLHHEAQDLFTTIADVSLTVSPHSQLDLRLSLRPILAHHGGEISARQATGLASFTITDFSGYDLHTAQAALVFRPDDATRIHAAFTAGDDRFWSAGLAFSLGF